MLPFVFYSHLYVIAQADEQRQHVEVCAEGGVIVQKLASRVSGDGGAALIADYGHNGTKTDTFRVSIVLTDGLGFVVLVSLRPCLLFSR